MTQQIILSDEKIINIVNKYVLSSNIKGIMLTGSYTDNSNNEKSDVDIIIVSDLVSRQTHEHVIDNKITYQFIILPYNKISLILYCRVIFRKS
jgi:predicted nucleotidyltransferase